MPLAKLHEQLSARRKRVEALEAVLRPLAERSVDFPAVAYSDDDYQVLVTLGLLRNARRVLDES